MQKMYCRNHKLNLYKSCNSWLWTQNVCLYIGAMGAMATEGQPGTQLYARTKPSPSLLARPAFVQSSGAACDVACRIIMGVEQGSWTRLSSH